MRRPTLTQLKQQLAAVEARAQKLRTKIQEVEAPPLVAGGDRFLTLDEVASYHPVSRQTRWRMIGRGEFPQPSRISPGRVGWKESTIKAWLQDLEAKQS